MPVHEISAGGEVTRPTPIQDPVEFAQLVELYRQRQPERVLEIGSWQGGTLWAWLDNGAPAFVGSIDIDHSAGTLPNPGPYADGYRTIEYCTAPSQSDRAIGWARQRSPFDWVFVDGAHDFRSVALDCANYWALMRSGGVMAFHDIRTPNTPITGDCEVCRLWDLIVQTQKYDTIELVHWGGNRMGIGVVFKP